MTLLYTIGIIVFSIAGALLAGYIAKTKNKGTHLVCPLGKSCDSVINSRFSKFLGIRNEIIGLAYYLGITIFYGLSLFLDIPQHIVFYVLLLAGFAFVFNLHLIVTQLIVLKKWCTTCLASSAISFMILVMSFLGFQASFGSYLFEIQDILKWVFIFMVIVGVITSSLHAKTFIKFLRDFEISKKESDRLSMFSHAGWVAITLASLAGIGLVLTDVYGNITGSSKFMVILVLLGILIIYEIVINMFIAPKLVDIHFGDHPELDDHKHSMLRKQAFAFVATGVVSWYMLLLLNALSFYGYSTGALLLIYIIVLIIAVGISLYADNLYYKRSVLVIEEKVVEVEEEIEAK
ncbi:MAG: vitamin K epoxide reductase family protein [Candidatus Pacebacteria bacterium]|nr:vitamin K epoxide reductase family protein [Candidatus Paceibacterota bacterium]